MSNIFERPRKSTILRITLTVEGHSQEEDFELDAQTLFDELVDSFEDLDMLLTKVEISKG